MLVAYVGWTSSPRVDHKQYLPEPTAPVHYRDPLKIKEYIDHARVKQSADAATNPILGQLEQVSILSANPKKHSHTLWAPHQPETVLELLSAFNAVFVVYSMTFLKLALAQHIDARGKLDPTTAWACISERTGFPYLLKAVPGTDGSKTIMDPLRALSGDIDVLPGQVMRRFGLEHPKDPRSASSWAAVARDAARLLGTA